MPQIRVSKPFSVQFAPGAKRRDFGPGDHVLTEPELSDWMVQGCIKAGRAELLPDADAPTDALQAHEATPDDEFVAALSAERAEPVLATLEAELETSVSVEQTADGVTAVPQVQVKAVRAKASGKGKGA